MKIDFKEKSCLKLMQGIANINNLKWEKCYVGI